MGRFHQGNDLGSRHYDADNSAVACMQLCKVAVQEVEEIAFGASGEICLHQGSHVLVVVPLAVRMNGVTAGMPPEVAVEGGADVIELMEKRHEFLVEIEIEKSRKAKRDQVQHIRAADDIALHLVRNAPPLPRDGPRAKAERRNTSLQAVGVAVPSLSDGEEQLRHVDVPEVGGTLDDVGADTCNVYTEIKRMAIGPAGGDFTRRPDETARERVFRFRPSANQRHARPAHAVWKGGLVGQGSSPRAHGPDSGLAKSAGWQV